MKEMIMDLRVLRMRSKKDAKSAVIAALVAVLVLQLFLVPLHALALWYSPMTFDVALVQAFSITLLTITIGHWIFLGLPVFLWLYHRERLSWNSVLGAGCLVGTLAGLFWALLEIPALEFTQILIKASLAHGKGFMFGLTFWIVWCLQNRVKILS